MRRKIAGLTAAALGAATLIAAPAVVLAAGTTASATKLVATVGPNETISLKTAAGARVKTLRPGSYAIVVRDRSDEHNFSLTGPKVRRTTSVGATGNVTWRVKLVRGTYRFVCIPHSDDMRGSFRVR